MLSNCDWGTPDVLERCHPLTKQVLKLRDTFDKAHGYENYVGNESYSDVKFVIEGRELHAHRLILHSSCSTKVFSRMFDSDSQDSQAGATIEIKGTTYAAFKHLLHFLYTGQLLESQSFEPALPSGVRKCDHDTLNVVAANELSDDTLEELMHLGERYLVLPLQQQVARLMIQRLERAFFFVDEEGVGRAKIEAISRVQVQPSAILGMPMLGMGITVTPVSEIASVFSSTATCTSTSRPCP